jgi:hypothetical protein
MTTITLRQAIRLVNFFGQALFQNGPIAEVGVNGVTHEVLLAIVADRLRSFQKGAVRLQGERLRADAHRGSAALVAAAHHRAHAARR